MNLPTYDFKEWLPHVFDVSKWFIKLNQPWIMIIAAMGIAYGIVAVIVWLMGFREDEEKEFDHEEY